MKININRNGETQQLRSKFIKFDTVDFYPSITEDLLLKYLEYARTIEAINEKVVKVIMHSH